MVIIAAIEHNMAIHQILRFQGQIRSRTNSRFMEILIKGFIMIKLSSFTMKTLLMMIRLLRVNTTKRSNSQEIKSI